MTAGRFFGTTGRGVAVAAILAAIGLTTVPRPADAGGGWGGGGIRASHSGVQVILEGTVEDAAERAHELCENGRALSKPYDHQLPLDRIRRLRAARDQAERDGSV